MAGARGSATAPFLEGSDGWLRPYLWLILKGPRAHAGIPIVGLVDTGADKSVLPKDYAKLLGYAADDLEPVEVGQMEGSAEAWGAQEPCEAFVNGIPGVKFEIQPLFVATLDALWGRADLMMTYTVCVSERDRELTLILD
jgi:hypothetical protein